MCESVSSVSSRRMQLIAIVLLIIYIYFAVPASTILYFWSMFYGNIYIRYLCILYGVFYLYDYETPSKGGRGVGCEWFRNLTIWKHFLDYFPINLVKTAELPPDRNYLFASFPHGVLCAGAFGNCMTNHSKWRSLFPGVRAKAATTTLFTILPVFRELMLSWGLFAANASSLTKLLTQSNDPIDKSNSDGFTSNGTVLVVGGVRESLLSSPNTYKILLRQRKGFVRIALECGVPIVPVISFGEVDLYDSIKNDDGSIWRKLEELFKNYNYLSAIYQNCRIFFQNNFSWIPKRKPITMVVGAPIATTKTSNPSDVEINEMHQLYTQRLIELFEEHKSKYVENHEQIFLEMV